MLLLWRVSALEPSLSRILDGPSRALRRTLRVAHEPHVERQGRAMTDALGVKPSLIIRRVERTAASKH